MAKIECHWCGGLGDTMPSYYGCDFPDFLDSLEGGIMWMCWSCGHEWVLVSEYYERRLIKMKDLDE